MDQTIFEQVDNYISALTAVEDEALLHARRSIEQANLPNQSISAVQGKMLQVFAKACNAKRILELGTFAAYSTLWLAKALPGDGKLITLEFDEVHARLARQNIDRSEIAERIELRTGKAAGLMNAMIDGNEPPFDLIFIDADKPPYKEYFQLALKLSHKGTFIVCDNVVRNGAVLDKQTEDERVQGVQRLNSYLKECSEVTATILQTVGGKLHDGMVLAVVN